MLHFSKCCSSSLLALRCQPQRLQGGIDMISDPQESILQLTAITGCNDYQAEVVLKRCDWDINVAVNSYFDNPPPEVSGI